MLNCFGPTCWCCIILSYVHISDTTCIKTGQHLLMNNHNLNKVTLVRVTPPCISAAVISRPFSLRLLRRICLVKEWQAFMLYAPCLMPYALWLHALCLMPLLKDVVLGIRHARIFMLIFYFSDCNSAFYH